MKTMFGSEQSQMPPNPNWNAGEIDALVVEDEKRLSNFPGTLGVLKYDDAILPFALPVPVDDS